jgi:hypothetical protein
MHRLIPATLLLLATTPAADAAERRPPRDRAATLRAVVDCRAIATAADRLACYDRSVAALDTAEREKRVVVLDERQVRETRRSMFGFASVSNPLIDGQDENDATQMREITTTVERATRDRFGKLVVTMDDGAVWHQADDIDLVRPPKKGSVALIRRATLGNYRMKLDGQVAIRVKREG